MTASSVDDRSSLIDIGARFDYAARVNDTVALRRCALYRRAFRGTAVAYPADVLRLGAVAKWMRREGVTVDVTSADELDRATAAGIPASRVVMHCNDANPDPIRCALDAGAARFVVGAPGQIAILAEGTRREQVVVDVSSPEASAFTWEVVAHDRLDLIGLHRRLDDGDDAAHVVQTLIVQMSRLSNNHGIVLSRISLAGFDHDCCGDLRALRHVAEAINDAVEDACAHCRYPRPAFTLSPTRASLLPAA